MKTLKSLVLGLALVGVSAQATSLHPDTFREAVAMNIAKLDVASVSDRGTVLRSSHHHPFSEFLIGIPVTVNTGDACTSFVGQTTTAKPVAPQMPVLTAMGASNPLTEACIAVMPRPVETQLTFKFQVLTGGFVPAQMIQEKVVSISGQGLFRVTLEMGSSTVKIQPLRVSAGRN